MGKKRLTIPVELGTIVPLLVKKMVGRQEQMVVVNAKVSYIDTKMRWLNLELPNGTFRSFRIMQKMAS